MSALFKPCRVLLKMLSPIVVSAFAPTLDGVLFEALRQRSPDKSDEELREKLKGVLKFNDELGVFHASSMRFGVTREQGVTTWEYRRGDQLHEGKRSSSMFSPNGKNRYKEIVVAGGPTKKRMTIRPAYCVPYAVFEAFGDASAIKDLLSNTFVGLGYDAQNVGMGAFDSACIEAFELEMDLSVSEAGLAKRPIPFGLAEGVATDAVLLPPYYAGTRQQCVVPERVSLINVESI